MEERSHEAAVSQQQPRSVQAQKLLNSIQLHYSWVPLASRCRSICLSQTRVQYKRCRQWPWQGYLRQAMKDLAKTILYHCRQQA